MKLTLSSIKKFAFTLQSYFYPWLIFLPSIRVNLVEDRTKKLELLRDLGTELSTLNEYCSSCYYEGYSWAYQLIKTEDIGFHPFPHKKIRRDELFEKTRIALETLDFERKKQYEHKIRLYQERATKSCSNSGEIQRKIESLKSRNTKASKDLQSIPEKIDSCRESFKDWIKGNSNSPTEFGPFLNNIKELENEIDANNKEICKLDQRLQEIKSDNSKLDIELKSLKASISKESNIAKSNRIKFEIIYLQQLKDENKTLQLSSVNRDNTFNRSFLLFSGADENLDTAIYQDQIDRIKEQIEEAIPCLIENKELAGTKKL